MSEVDLVERLRSVISHDGCAVQTGAGLIREAAEEVERLRNFGTTFRKQMERERTQFQETITRLTKALEFYADEENWEEPVWTGTRGGPRPAPAHEEAGDDARAALPPKEEGERMTKRHPNSSPYDASGLPRSDPTLNPRPAMTKPKPSAAVTVEERAAVHVVGCTNRKCLADEFRAFAAAAVEAEREKIAQQFDDMEGEGLLLGTNQVVELIRHPERWRAAIQAEPKKEKP